VGLGDKKMDKAEFQRQWRGLGQRHGGKAEIELGLIILSQHVGEEDQPSLICHLMG
jgi:hypothetical protein